MVPAPDQIRQRDALQPSSFIKELPPEWIERVDLKKLLSTPVAESTGKSRFAQMRAALQGD